MTAFIIRRLASLLFVLWGAVTLLFFLFFLLPSDPAELIAGGNNKNPDPQVVENIREKYGFNEPIIVQYGKYLGRLVTFDFGTSYRDGKSVNDVIKEKAPASLRLAFWAIAIETVVGVGAGVLAAVRKYSVADTVTTLLAAILSAIPVFVLAYFMQQVTGVMAHKYGWPSWASFPVQGIGPNEWFFGVIPASLEQAKYLVQPAIVLASVSTVIVARLARTTMLEVGKLDFIRTARSKGLSERDITRKHALRNAMIPVVTYIGIDFGTLVGAAILTETVFNWPGLGSQIARAADGRDLPVLLGLTLRGGAHLRRREHAGRHQLRLVRPPRPTRRGLLMENDELPDVPVDLKPGVSPDLLPTLPPNTLPSEEAPQQTYDGYLAGPGHARRPDRRAGSVDSTLTEVIEARSFRQDAWRRFKKNKLAMFGLVLVIVLIVIAIIGPFLVQNPLHQERTIFRSAPDAQHWLGTDQVGRDVLARAVYGIRLSLFIGFVVTMLETIIGVSLGRAGRLAGPIHRHDDHAHRRRAARHPLPGAGLRLHRGDRSGRRRGDPHPRPHVVAHHRPCRAGRLPAGQAVRVRRGRPRRRRRRLPHHVAPHPAQRGPADHRAGGGRHRQRGAGRGGAVVPRRRRAGADAVARAHDRPQPQLLLHRPAPAARAGPRASC